MLCITVSKVSYEILFVLDKYRRTLMPKAVFVTSNCLVRYSYQFISVSSL